MTSYPPPPGGVPGPQGGQPDPYRARQFGQGGLVPSQQQEAVLFQLGDITVTPTTIITPNGRAPLAGSTWIAVDQSRTEERMPAFAIILAIVFFLFCLLGLLFLLIKERKTTGYIEVRVQAGQLIHMTQIPAQHRGSIDEIRHAVSQVQAAAQHAPR